MFQRSPYNIWEGFGSDGYLYDFVKRGGPDPAPDWEEAPASRPAPPADTGGGGPLAELQLIF